MCFTGVHTTIQRLRHNYQKRVVTPQPFKDDVDDDDIKNTVDPADEAHATIQKLSEEVIEDYRTPSVEFVREFLLFLPPAYQLPTSVVRSVMTTVAAVNTHHEDTPGTKSKKM